MWCSMVRVTSFVCQPGSLDSLRVRILPLADHDFILLMSSSALPGASKQQAVSLEMKENILKEVENGVKKKKKNLRWL